jgi:PAS domain S-box-containing protein
MSVETEHDRIDAEINRVRKSNDPFAAAVRATRMPMLITDPNRPDNPIVFVNDAFTRLTGYSREECIGFNCRFLQGPDTDPADVAKLREAIERRSQIEMDIINHRKDGSRFYNRVLISPVYDEDGRLSFFFASQFDVTLERERLVRLQADRDQLEKEVERRTRELRLSEERLGYTMKAARVGAWTLDLTEMRLTCSSICKRNFGRLASEPFTYEDLLNSIVADERPRMQESVREAIENRKDYEHEYRITTPSGETRWIVARGRPFYGMDGTPMSMSGVTLDMTESKRNEEQRVLLTAELKHRVKNSMATIQSIATQTLRNASSLKEATEVLTARIQSLASAHDLLTR